ncbi:MAG: fumarate hydratase [Candidatus Micrarchaeota archaeon]
MYLKEVLSELIERGVTSIPQDINNALARSHSKEKNGVAKTQLSLIIRNISLAKKNGVPLCQDTGIPVFYVRIGRRCTHIFDIERELSHAIIESTKKSLLRPNIVNPISRKNSGNNTGNGVPIMHYELFDGDYIKITYVPKGAGTENMGKLLILSPNDGEDEIERHVLGHVRWMGGKPCPPYILGIGIGGTSERCMELAKMASIKVNKQKEQRWEDCAL